MRNIPKHNSYFAMLIEFNYEDFEGIPSHHANKPDYFIGNTTLALKHCLQQFVESSAWAPEEIIAIRKREILTLLYHLGYTEVVSMKGQQKSASACMTCSMRKFPQGYYGLYLSTVSDE